MISILLLYFRVKLHLYQNHWMKNRIFRIFFKISFKSISCDIRQIQNRSKSHLIASYKNSDGRPTCCFRLVSFSLLLLLVSSVSVSVGRPSCYSSVSFFLFFSIFTDFVQAITQTRFDRFWWNFQILLILVLTFSKYFLVHDVISIFGILTFYWFSECRLVQGVLKNYKTYWVQNIRIDKQKNVDMY